MPELPEVESTARYLQERIGGARIVSSNVLWSRTIATPRASAFERDIRGATITKVFRRGKFIGIALKSCRKKCLFVHLRMSGFLAVVSEKLPLKPHDRVVLYLNNGKSLRFNDTRKFGRMYLCSEEQDVVGKLGMEPLCSEFTPNYLEKVLQKHSGCIKPLLLNQSVIAGLGNIYADEVLWKSSLHPQTCAARITTTQIEILHSSIQEILSSAIELAGTDFGDGVVDGGMYTPLVYGREDEPCKRCKTQIRKIIVGQRGTHFCPTCQKRRGRLRRKSLRSQPKTTLIHRD